MPPTDDILTVRKAIKSMEEAGWRTTAYSSSAQVYTLQSKTGERTIILVGKPDSPIIGEAADRIRDRAELRTNTSPGN